MSDQIKVHVRKEKRRAQLITATMMLEQIFKDNLYPDEAIGDCHVISKETADKAIMNLKAAVTSIAVEMNSNCINNRATLRLMDMMNGIVLKH